MLDYDGIHRLCFNSNICWHIISTEEIMDILEVYPKDLHVRFEMSMTEVQKLLDFLDNCEFHGDPKSREMIEAKDYVIGNFFPKLDKLTEDVVRGGM